MNRSPDTLIALIFFPGGSAGAVAGYLANPVLKRGRDAQRIAG